MKSVEIGKIVRKTLMDDKELNAVIKGNIYPLIAPANSSFPFIVYSKNSIIAEYSKDGNTVDNIDFQVICVDTNYDKVVEIADRVRELLECKRNDTIYFIRLESITEAYNEDAFQQQLNFKITNINK